MEIIKLDEIINRLLNASKEKTERGLSLWMGKKDNYINNCKTRKDISIKALMKICEEKKLDFNYIYYGTHSKNLVYLNDDEMIVKKSEWNKLNIIIEEYRGQIANRIPEHTSQSIAAHQEGQTSRDGGKDTGEIPDQSLG